MANREGNTFAGDARWLDASDESFAARITAVVTDSFGINWYQWQEQVADADTGVYADYIPGRFGTYDPSSGAGVNPAQERNNQLVAVDTIVRLNYRSMIGGYFFWDFTAQPQPTYATAVLGTPFEAADYGVLYNIGFALSIPATPGFTVVTAELLCLFNMSVGAININAITGQFQDTISGDTWASRIMWGQGATGYGTIGGAWETVCTLRVIIPGPSPAMTMDIQVELGGTGWIAAIIGPNSTMDYVQYPG